MSIYPTVRSATLADIPPIIQLFHDTVTTVNARDYSAEQIHVWAAKGQDEGRWEARIREQYFLVACYEELITGAASLAKDGCLDVLYVHRDFQGRGIAGKLLIIIEQEAQRWTLREIYSDVSITARPFMEKRGYQVEKEQRPVVNNVTFVNYRMTKQIRRSPPDEYE